MNTLKLQFSMFEEDYLLRELGPVAHTPHVALTELVANSWDAGASFVDLVIPSVIGGTLTVTDDGHGMTQAQFKKRWMTLRYNRLKHQQADVEFPPIRKSYFRRSYGRNGIGRHGLLCFGDEYKVDTWRDGKLSTFVVGTVSGPSPFAIRKQSFELKDGHGIKLAVIVERKLPDPDEILTVLTTRFVHDPKFTVRVNGATRTISDTGGKIFERPLVLDGGGSATVIVIDSTRLNQSAIHQGVAFWVGGRLVGNPSWLIGAIVSFDGRTRFAKRYTVVVKTSGFDGEVNEDWTEFKKSDRTKQLFERTADAIQTLAREIAFEIVEESSEDALTEHRDELAILGQGAQREVAEFTKAVALASPTVSAEFLSAAVNAVINLEKSKSGAALLQKLSALPADDVGALDTLLSEWTAKDALKVLDEIDSRIGVIETIRRIAGDPETDELNTLHPLVLRSRWLFGPEFESNEYCSNVTLQKIARELFKKENAQFINERNRPDIVVLPAKSSIQLTGIESFDSFDSSILQINHILLIELKKGGFKITRNEVNQADGYVQDIASSCASTGAPFIHAWVVGESIAAGVATDKSVGENGRSYGRVRATTFSALVDTANRRLFRLKDSLNSKYESIPTDDLLARVLSKPIQGKLLEVSINRVKS
jgi:Histidine kinase-, DNA gyrase B-, and HSP90-like ATPase